MGRMSASSLLSKGGSRKIRSKDAVCASNHTFALLRMQEYRDASRSSEVRFCLIVSMVALV